MMLSSSTRLFFACFFSFVVPVLLWQRASFAAADHLILVQGAGGTDEFETAFQQAAEKWTQLAQERNWSVSRVGGTDAAQEQAAERPSPKTQLLKLIADAKASPPNRLWVVMIGHGTNGAGIAKFNMVGEDIAATEFAETLADYSQRLVLVNCSSASGPFLPVVSKPNRIVITATRNGGEQNYSRFAQFMAAALQLPAADLDHDDEVSLLEAFLHASGQTNQFYEEASRLATEHALIDDNGDGRGTSVDFYKGIQVVRQPKEGTVDGQASRRVTLATLAAAVKLSEEQLQARELIETQIDQLRSRKNRLDSEIYLGQLEDLMLEMVEVYGMEESSE